MLDTLARDVMQFLHQHPNWGSLLTFIVAFAESLAVIGTIVPGSVTMTAIGIIVGTGALPMFSTLAWATLGALCGDFLSYWAGKYCTQQIRESRFFQGRGHWLEKGEAFFHQHGGKSVIIGRFFGPVRSLVPLIAGLLKMTTPRFTLAVIPAAFLWAVAYMLPGIAIGAMSQELPPNLATRFVLYGLLTIFGIWLITRIGKLFFDQIWFWIDQAVTRLWQWQRQKKGWRWFTKLLSDPKDPDNHQQLMLVFIAITSACGFMLIGWHVTHHGVLTSLNSPILHLMSSIRLTTLDYVMVAISQLGNKIIMLPFCAVIGVFLLARRRYRAATHWAAMVLLGIGSAYLIKHGLYVPRPNLFLKTVSASSFPSGHVTIATLIFGFIAVLIGHELPSSQKRTPYRIAAMVVSAVAVSRLYLGAHWLTDTLASILLGLCVISIVTLSYRRHLLSHIHPKIFVIFATCSYFIIALGVNVFNFQREVNDYQMVRHTQPIPSVLWWENTNNYVPLYRDNRLGTPIEMLFIQWADTPDHIRTQLERSGWRTINNGSSVRNMLQRAKERHGPYRLTLLPQQFRYHAPRLTMINTQDTRPFVLRLWSADIVLMPEKTPLLVGNMTVMKSHIKDPAANHIPTAQIIQLLTQPAVTLKQVTLPPELKQRIPSTVPLRMELLRLKPTQLNKEQPQ